MADMPLVPAPMPAVPGLAPAAPMTAEEQPLEVRLAYGTGLHNIIVARLRARQEMAQKKIEERYDAWDAVDESTRLFLDLSKSAKRADGSVDTSKKENPFDRGLVVPVSYTLLDIYLTQLLGIFTARDPYIQLGGRGGEDVSRAKVMEVTLAYDTEQMKYVMVVHALFQDGLKYGIGVVYDTWDERPGWIYPPEDPGIKGIIRKALGIEVPPKWGVLAEHNRWANVDPFLFWPDPRVPISRLQEGEFVGHRTFRGYHWLVERSQKHDGPYFNLEFLKEVAGARETQQDRSRSRFTSTDLNVKETADSLDRGWFACDHLQVKLIPAEWKLGPGDLPEIWWFTVAEKGLIIRAHKSDYRHGKFTYAAIEPNHDPHVLFNPGKLEDANGMQRIINWIVNVNVTAAMKALNDAGIVNDDCLVLTDLTHPNPGRWVRLTQEGKRRNAGGIPVAAMMERFPPMDVSSVNMQLAGYLYDQFQRMFGISDTLMAMPTSDKRTLGEVQQVNAAATQRIAKLAKIFDDQAIGELSSRAVANRQQFTTQQQWYRIPGGLVDELGVNMQIGAEDLAGDFDYIPITPTLPNDPSRNPMVIIKILEMVAKFPMLAVDPTTGRRLNFIALFKEACRLQGMKNISTFYEAPQMPPMMPGMATVMPNAAVQAGVQAGNVVPAGPVVRPGIPPG